MTTAMEHVATYWRAANYLAAAQIYLRDNVLLTDPLSADDIKPRLLGHWGTVPGINFVYAHLNRLIQEHDRSVLLVTGPGHGAPGNLANLYLEGSLGERYPEYQVGPTGLRRLVQSFSWPGGFPSHLTPATPGAIHEGGELGYALATAFGAAFDNPDLLVACIVGDGEAETGPTATAWHLTKFLNPRRDGAVLPILHLNQYKISSRTIFGSMTDEELLSLMRGYGYAPQIVEVGQDEQQILDDHSQMARAIDHAHRSIEAIQSAWRAGNGSARPRWPMLILRSPKGWTVVDELQGTAIEGTYRAHQVPIPDPKHSAEQRNALEKWLRSYQPEQLFDPIGNVIGAWNAWLPTGDRRLGMVPQANGGQLRRPLQRPAWRDFGLEIDTDQRGSVTSSDTQRCGDFLQQVIADNRGRFRIFCPDEIDSNRLSAVFKATDRQFLWPAPDGSAPEEAEHIAPAGDVLEILSEHTCQAWLQGYLLTGRHGLFPSYEAFISIVDSMLGQYAKFLKRAGEIPWRQPVSSLNYLLSSEGWRQDHNGYSHQMPGFINTLLNKKAQHVRIYLPPDTNCLLSTMHHCLNSTDKINLVIASKQPMPQWLDVDEAEKHCRQGISIWRWISSYNAESPDVVLACAGVYPTAEAVVAARYLFAVLPELRLRFINVTDLLILEQQSFHPHGLTDQDFQHYFTTEQPVVFNFHGYPSAVKQLLWNRPHTERFRINGYIEEGTTTTPLSLLAANHIDRFTLVDQILTITAVQHPEWREQCEVLRGEFKLRRESMLAFAQREGEDAEEFQAWHRSTIETLA